MKISLKAKYKRIVLAIPAVLAFTLLLPTVVYAQAACEVENPNSTTVTQCVRQNPITKDLNTIINGLSIGVGMIIAGSLIFAGIQYMTGGQNSQQVSNAKRRIGNSLIALLVYFLSVAFLQWLVPGGIFG